MIKKRVEYIDLAKGICIFLVAFNHTNVIAGSTEYPLSDALCIMRMPLYFFLSGLFFKPYENYHGFLIRKVNKLLIPFLFFRIVSCIIGPLANKTPIEWHTMWDFLYTQLSAPNTPLWFLMCLFWLNQMFYGIYKVAFKTKFPIAIIVGLSFLIGIVGFYSGKTEYNIQAMNIGTAMTAIPFFCMGYIFKNYTDILYPAKWDKYLLYLAVGCAVYTILFAQPVGYFTNKYDANLWVTYSCGLSGILCVLFVSKLIRRLPFVSYCGRYSIMILVTHMPIIQRVMPVLTSFEWPLYWQLIACTIIVISAYLAIIPFMRRFLPYVTAQKDVIPVK